MEREVLFDDGYRGSAPAGSVGVIELWRMADGSTLEVSYYRLPDGRRAALSIARRNSEQLVGGQAAES